MSKASLRSFLHRSGSSPDDLSSSGNTAEATPSLKSPDSDLAVTHSSATPSTPEGQTPGRRTMGLWSSVPSLLLLGLAIAAKDTLAPAPQGQLLPLNTVNSARSPVLDARLAEGILSSSQTLVVTPKKLSGYVLQGELQPTSSVTGQAPLSGQIARVLVKPGQRVRLNQKVLELSTGATTRVPAGAERAQDSAEAAQVAAARQQEAVNTRIQGAQARLHQAQLRVTSAKRRVAQALEIVQKLQRGESVQVPTVGSAPEAPRRRKRARRSTDAGPAPGSAAQREAEREAAKAKGAVAEAEDKLSRARLAVKTADQQVKETAAAVEKASAAADKVQAAFEAGEAKGSDVATARAALASASGEQDSAEAMAGVAHSALERLQANVESLQIAARRAASRASRIAAAAKRSQTSDSGDDGQEEAPAPTEAGPDSQSPLIRAVELVRHVKAESEDAAREVEHITREIDNYERQVNRTKQRLDSTGQALEAAQERMLDYNLQANLSSVRAPAAGVVLSVAEIARDVSSGDPVVTIGRTDLLEARFEDRSDAWKKLKPGMLLAARVHDPASSTPVSPPTTGATSDSATPASTASAAGNKPPGSAVTGNKAPAGLSTMVRVRKITPPAKPGDPAVLRVRIINPRVPVESAEGRIYRRLFSPGMAVACSLNKPESREVLTVPVNAILKAADGSPMVAVLKPVENGPSDGAAQAGEATASSGAPDVKLPANPAKPDQAQVHQLAAQRENAHDIEWRPITLGTGNGQEQEIVDGLMPGERIALMPLALYQFEAIHGPSTPVRLEFTS